MTSQHEISTLMAGRCLLLVSGDRLGSWSTRREKKRMSPGVELRPSSVLRTVRYSPVNRYLSIEGAGCKCLAEPSFPHESAWRAGSDHGYPVTRRTGPGRASGVRMGRWAHSGAGRHGGEIERARCHPGRRPRSGRPGLGIRAAGGLVRRSPSAQSGRLAAVRRPARTSRPRADPGGSTRPLLELLRTDGRIREPLPHLRGRPALGPFDTAGRGGDRGGRRMDRAARPPLGAGSTP
jgi:hypothetical protein